MSHVLLYGLQFFKNILLLLYRLQLRELSHVLLYRLQLRELSRVLLYGLQLRELSHVLLYGLQLRELSYVLLYGLQLKKLFHVLLYRLQIKELSNVLLYRLLQCSHKFSQDPRNKTYLAQITPLNCSCTHYTVFNMMFMYIKLLTYNLFKTDIVKLWEGLRLRGRREKSNNIYIYHNVTASFTVLNLPYFSDEKASDTFFPQLWPLAHCIQ